MARARLFAHSPYSSIEAAPDKRLVRGADFIEVTDDEAYRLLRGYHEHVEVEADPAVVADATDALAALPRPAPPTVALPQAQAETPKDDVPLPPELMDKIDG